MGKKQYIMIAVAVVLVGAVAYGLYFMNGVKRYKEEVNSIKIEDVDLSKVNDGYYFGQCDVDYIAAKVEVVVEDHKITDIKLLEHKNGRGTGAETVPKAVVKAQSLKVDTVTGATNSSKVILKAINNALAPQSN